MEYGLSLGSNQGDRLSNLRLTIEKISHLENTAISAQSQIYETEPLDVPREHRDEKFLNCAIAIDSTLSPTELLKELQILEIDMGRPPDHSKNTPRPIDIDIIYADNTILETPELTIPHPRWPTRRFVVEPLADIRPDLVIPKADISIQQTLNNISA